ncbi:hypothetical protein, partial [Salmonella sp. s51228]|uniref:hypothetical protein n=1 Tax=Salmonella sp. s51228 TaxID=3159652 RepID=UPI00397F2345
MYSSFHAGLSINGFAMCHTAADISNGNVPRLSFTPIGSDTSVPPALYTISPYSLQDSVSTYRCCAVDTNPPSMITYTATITPLLAD